MTGEESWTKIKACQLGTTSKRVRGGKQEAGTVETFSMLSTVNMNRMIVSRVKLGSQPLQGKKPREKSQGKNPAYSIQVNSLNFFFGLH